MLLNPKLSEKRWKSASYQGLIQATLMVLLFLKGLEFITLQGIAFIKRTFALHKIFKLKRRYIFTRSNRLRLRYVCGCFLLLLALISLGVGTSRSSFALLSTPAVVQEVAMNRSAENRAAEIEIKPNIIEGETRIQDTPDSVVESAEATVGEALQNKVSGSIRKASFAIKKPPEPSFREMTVGTGETLAGILQDAGLSSADAYYAVKALSEYHNPRSIRPGQVVRVDFNLDDAGNKTFKSLSMSPDPIKTIHVYKRTPDLFESDIEEKDLVERTYARSAEIETSLYGSAARSDIPPQIIAEIIRIYSWNVDFQRDIRQGDGIEVLYETLETEDGAFARYGDVLYAKLSVGGRDIPIYRYEMNDGRVDYFGPDGYSIKKILMKTPVDGARISSTFGMRHHPVLGYNKMHKGMDFAAPTGTPIYAAGDGVIDYLGRRGGYGNYIRIRHNSKLKTAYAHMHNYARGMAKGKRVKQGEVIGYIGTTGRSTGPHLHYEVLMHNKQVNPNSVDLPTGEQLEGEELERFKALMKGLDQQYVAQTGGLKFARKADKSNTHQHAHIH